MVCACIDTREHLQALLSTFNNHLVLLCLQSMLSTMMTYVRLWLFNFCLEEAVSFEAESDV
jgi:hypothetical protein